MGDNFQAPPPDGYKDWDDYFDDLGFAVDAKGQAPHTTAAHDTNASAQVPAVGGEENFLEIEGDKGTEEFETVYLRLIKEDLAEARKHDIPADARRGLTEETLKHFGFGYLPAWILTKSRAKDICGLNVDKKTGELKRLPPPSARIIIPTPSGEHFNAVVPPAERWHVGKDFWKQHAGKMELFGDAEALKLNADVLVVVEGEIDAASIWQASYGDIAAVAILGCNNGKKTLLPRIRALRGKKVLVLLDADKDGNKAADRLLKALHEGGVLAVRKRLFDFLDKNGHRTYGQKVDCNDILRGEGEFFLSHLLRKIIDSAEYEFSKLADIVNRPNPFGEGTEHVFHFTPKKTRKSARLTGEVRTFADGDARNEISLILKDYVHAGALGYHDWFVVGAIMHRYGFTLEDFQDWSNDGDLRYSAERCENNWNSYGDYAATHKPEEGYGIGTLINIAKENGYTPTTKTKTAEPAQGAQVPDDTAHDPVTETSTPALDALPTEADMPDEECEAELPAGDDVVYTDEQYISLKGWNDSGDDEPTAEDEQTTEAAADTTDATHTDAADNRSGLEKELPADATQSNDSSTATSNDSTTAEPTAAAAQKPLTGGENDGGDDDGEEEFDEKPVLPYIFCSPNDLGNSERLEKFCGDRVKWVTDTERWLIWQERGVWERASDKSACVYPYVVELAAFLEPYVEKRKQIRDKAGEGVCCYDMKGEPIWLKQERRWDWVENPRPTDEQREAFEKAVRLWLKIKNIYENFTRKATVSNAVEMFKGRENVMIRAEDLDRHNNLLCVQNGVVDLETKWLYPADPKLFLTQQIKVPLDWKYWKEPDDIVGKFLRSILPDDETLTGLMRWFGYCLTGEVREEKALTICGRGGNGKGTLTRMLMQLFGDYAVSLPVTAVCEAGRSGEANAHTAELNGLERARLAVVEELPQGRKLDNAKFKLLTGGDEIPIRRLHQEGTKILPTHKIVMSGNHRPELTDAREDALLRRIIAVDFKQKFTDANRDTRLKEKLLSPDAQKTMLVILVQQAYKWYRDGLIISADMKQSTSNYFNENDFLAAFIEEHCEFVPDGHIELNHFIHRLRSEYKRETDSISDRSLKEMLKRLSGTNGIEYRRVGKQHRAGLQGIKFSGGCLDNGDPVNPDSDYILLR